MFMKTSPGTGHAWPLTTYHLASSRLPSFWGNPFRSGQTPSGHATATRTGDTQTKGAATWHPKHLMRPRFFATFVGSAELPEDSNFLLDEAFLTYTDTHCTAEITTETYERRT